MKKVLKGLAILLGAVVLLAAVLIGWLSVTEFRPEEVETVDAQSMTAQPVFDGDAITVLSMNIGYCALGQSSDFFMDGGDGVRPDSKDVIAENLRGVSELLARADADFYLLQEVDLDSKRSYNTDERDALTDALGVGSVFALNYSCDYVPYPLPTIGQVRSGLLTMSGWCAESAQRLRLPCPFSWPVSTANLKRCLLVSYVPLTGTDKQLVLVNLHLEAYDDGEGKAAQTKQLWEFLQAEYDKGNYVIAGGDFNQVFPDTPEHYPNTHAELWTPGTLTADALPDGWQYAYDAAVPTCRLLNQPYDAADTVNTQYYVIDGFLLSPNLTLTQVQTLDEDFHYSDHNPVLLTVQPVEEAAQ